ncbi:MAG: LON peptidase substrate-binding domain-containing protein [Pyrinomonadaceae bacterium]
MTDFLDKLSGIKQLPLFPLPVILFPGTPLPLHIFEPRYRQMLKDVQITNNLFGIPFFDQSESEENRPSVGTVGCVAELRDEQSLEDGRSNVLTVGIVRFRLENYVDADDPYFVGEVSYFEDEPEDAELLEPRARAVKDLFLRVAKAVREMAGENVQLPDLPDITPEQLSFFVAAAIDFDIKLKYQLLEMRSTGERLKRLYELLSQAVAQVEDRADVHKIAQTNGHSKKKIDLP